MRESIYLNKDGDDPVKMNQLRDKATRLYEMQNLYKELCFEFCMVFRSVNFEEKLSNRRR